MNINYDYYKVFYYVAKYKSFTGAAGALYSNQPNITRIIKKLENELGCTLFIRQRHGVSLTPEGEKLYLHIQAAVGHILQGEQEIAKDKELKSGVITIAASEIALHCLLLPKLKEFRKKYPGIRVRISNHSTPQAIDVLRKGLADFAVVTEPFELPQGIISMKLREIQEIPVCSRAFAIERGSVLTIEELTKLPLIGLDENTGSFSFYSEFFQNNGSNFVTDVEAATADQILPMVKSDLGIGFVPKDFLDKEEALKLIEFKLEPPVPKRNICVLKRKDTLLSIAAAQLYKFIY